jgi:hypothetical protein
MRNLKLEKLKLAGAGEGDTATPVGGAGKSHERAHKSRQDTAGKEWHAS